MTWLSQLVDYLGRFRFWFLLRPWERGLRIRAGKHVDEVGPGLHPCIPLLDEVFVQSTRRRVLNLPIQTVQSRGGQTLTVSGVVTWRIESVRRMYERLHTPEDWIYNGALSAIAEAIAESVEVLGPKELGAAAAARLKTSRGMGVRVIGVTITDHAIVRTYRLISGEGNSGWSWERLGALEHVQGHKAS